MFAQFGTGHEIDLKLLLGLIGVIVPGLAAAIILAPISPEADKSPVKGGFCGFRLNGAWFGAGNYFAKLASFFKKATSKNWRESYAQWFADQTEQDPTVGE